MTEGIVSAQVVRYIGTSGVREITDEQWADASVSGQETTVWSRRNRWEIPIEQFNDSALQWIQDNEPDIIVVTPGV